MNGTGKILSTMMLASLLLLLYVHEQISLFRISYTLDTKSERLTQLSEEYRQMRFEVEQLKAPRLLEEKMKQLELELTLPQEIRVVRTPPEFLQPVQSVRVQAPGRWFDFLGRWIGVAQAKTEDS